MYSSSRVCRVAVYLVACCIAIAYVACPTQRLCVHYDCAKSGCLLSVCVKRVNSLGSALLIQ